MHSPPPSQHPITHATLPYLRVLSTLHVADLASRQGAPKLPPARAAAADLACQFRSAELIRAGLHGLGLSATSSVSLAWSASVLLYKQQAEAGRCAAARAGSWLTSQGTLPLSLWRDMFSVMQCPTAADITLALAIASSVVVFIALVLSWSATSYAARKRERCCRILGDDLLPPRSDTVQGRFQAVIAGVFTLSWILLLYDFALATSLIPAAWTRKHYGLCYTQATALSSMVTASACCILCLAHEAWRMTHKPALMKDLKGRFTRRRWRVYYVSIAVATVVPTALVDIFEGPEFNGVYCWYSSHTAASIFAVYAPRIVLLIAASVYGLLGMLNMWRVAGQRKWRALNVQLLVQPILYLICMAMPAWARIHTTLYPNCSIGCLLVGLAGCSNAVVAGLNGVLAVRVHCRRTRVAHTLPSTHRGAVDTGLAKHAGLNDSGLEDSLTYSVSSPSHGPVEAAFSPAGLEHTESELIFAMGEPRDSWPDEATLLHNEQLEPLL